MLKIGEDKIENDHDWEYISELEPAAVTKPFNKPRDKSATYYGQQKNQEL